MKAKRFVIAALAAALVILGALVLLVSLSDPFFVLGGIEKEETALFDNQRYEMAGLIRHQDYSAVVMGTSLVANYRASWFAEGLGEETLKITFPDGWVSEFDRALELAFRTHEELDTVFFGLDPNILIRSDSQRTVELPAYLYNLNPLDDVEYLLNADTYRLALSSWYKLSHGVGVTLDEAYVWDDGFEFSRETALEYYPRPEVSDTVLPANAYLEAVEENLDVVCRWAEEHPDVDFVIWFPPYSILYWDKMTREGTAEAVITAVEHASYRLMEYENISVHCFLHNYPVIQNLDYYTDHIHCSGFITQDTAGHLLAGRWKFNAENCKMRLDELRQFVASYDYDSLFAE